jgi:hypothetical protein
MLGRNKAETPLHAAMNELLRELVQVEGDSEQAERIVARLTELNELEKTNSSGPVSKDALVTAGANLAGILLILNYERAHVVTSKALGFVMKLR